MALEKILEGLNKDIFNKEMVEEVQKVFDSAVEEKAKKATKIVEHKCKRDIEKIKKEYESLSEKCIKENEKRLSIQKSKSNAHLNRLVDRLTKKEKLIEKSLKNAKKDLHKEFREKYISDKNQLQKEYAHIVEKAIKEEVSQLVRESGDLFEEAVRTSRQKVMQESIKATMKISGNKIDFKNDSQNSNELERLKNENEKLNKRIENLLKKSIFEKVSKDMSLTQKENLKTLVENIDFINEKQYEIKLKNLTKNIGSSNSFNRRSNGEEKNFIMNENVREKDILRSVPYKKEGIYANYLK